MTDLTSLEAELSAQAGAAADLAALDAVRVAALGKTGSISNLLKSLGGMSPDERKTAGPAINGLRDRVSMLIADRCSLYKATSSAGSVLLPKADDAAVPCDDGAGDAAGTAAPLAAPEFGDGCG